MNATADQAMTAEHLGERVELLLQRRAGAGDRRQHGGDLSHLGLHAGRRDDDGRGARGSPTCSGKPCWSGRRAPRPPPRSVGASLGTGALSPVSAASCVSSVADVHDAAVGRDDVARFELHDVAGHEVDRRHERTVAVADDLGLRHLHLGEGVDAGACLRAPGVSRGPR